MRPVEQVLERLEDVYEQESGWRARCPVHNGRQRSLSINEGDDGRALLKCFAGCDNHDVVAAMGLPMRVLFHPSANGSANGRSKPSASWKIRDAESVVQAEHVRFERDDGKECLWRLPGVAGWGLKGRKVETLPLYRSEHIKDWPQDVSVVVCEGEPAADALSEVYPATLATVTGANSAPGQQVLEVLRGRSVVLWQDSDEPGRKHMQKVAALLQGIAKEVRIFDWADAGVPNADIEREVRRWFVMSILTGRYSGSPETTFDQDIRQVHIQGIATYADNVIRGQLSDAFWDASLPQAMDTSVASSPYFRLFQASQVKMNDLGFLSKDITVRELIEVKSDVHHIFPRDYLKKRGMTRGQYNQIANYAVTQSEINIAIGNREPQVYFNELREQVQGGPKHYGNITDPNILGKNLRAHCIPEGVIEMTADDYPAFLAERRKLMAQKIRSYFEGL